jgi:hypothetical protein
VTGRAVRAGVVASLGALAALACQVNRDRPGPPRLAITLDQDSVHSPDTITGSLLATDAEGIDSIWLSVDSAPPVGEDGLLQQTFLAPFRAEIKSGHPQGTRVPVRTWARDISGYTGGLDTFVVVIGP